ncbi:hypothetical protein ACFYV7_39390 [Nocardia suismassiliense]|uniref:Uncharacterized protein n=1 Tax=Nocardia suismassiliense TaxID=2077092 RepID=A0ABW6R750_9NOCA
MRKVPAALLAVVAATGVAGAVFASPASAAIDGTVLNCVNEETYTEYQQWIKDADAAAKKASEEEARKKSECEQKGGKYAGGGKCQMPRGRGG